VNPPLLALADEGGNDIMVEEARNGSGGSSLRIQVTDDGAARHVVVSELARSPAGAEIVTRTADYSGADADALRAAIQADDSLIVLAEESEEFTDLPIVAGPSLLADATPAAAPAMGTLPLAAPALTLQAGSGRRQRESDRGDHSAQRLRTKPSTRWSSSVAKTTAVSTCSIP
jgi:hypothetical protein